jgi:OOP family OmpA-OmpF porin
MVARSLIVRVALVVTALTATALANATIPTADRKGSKDHPLLKRYQGSFIVAYEQQGFAEFTLPTSPLAPVPDKRTRQNNTVHLPKTKKDLEGAYTRLVYLLPEKRSPLEVLRNYQDEITGRGGKALFTCRGEECGGDPERSSGGGGGNVSLAMFLYPADRITDAFASNGHCAQAESITDQRYLAAEMPEVGAHVSVLTYTLVAPDPSDVCLAFNGRTIAVVDIVEARARETRMVTVAAGEMAKSIESTGRVALYGILFDFNKAEVKPESDPTLTQIAQLLKSTPAMKLLVVGHTDNVGGFASNMDLSQRRAAAVVAALATRFGIGKDRLTPVGVSFASPVASNQTDDGRSRNRRVELVEQVP